MVQRHLVYLKIVLKMLYCFRARDDGFPALYVGWILSDDFGGRDFGLCLYPYLLYLRHGCSGVKDVIRTCQKCVENVKNDPREASLGDPI